MNCAERDIMINNINSEIAYKKGELLKKRNYLKSLVTGNEFLEEVVNDYDNYYNYIKKQKQDQYNALAKISDYLDKISANVKTTDNMLNETKYDQKQLLNQMNIIKKEIDNLTYD